MTEPAWRTLHDAWWAERRTPQPGDLEAAWEALWAVVPPDGWSVSRPTHDGRSRQWHCTAIRLRPVSRKRADDVAGNGTILIGASRCVSEVRAGRVPR